MRRAFPWAVLPALLTAPAFAEETARLDTGNTAWMLMASALVVFMTVPGLALFYGGLDRSKSILNTIAMSLVAFSIVSITWLAIGYSIAYGDDIGKFIGNPLQYLFARGISGINPDTGYPALLDVMFQLTFATITTALVSGSLVGRMKFSAWIIFCILWSIVVYPPIAHWVWGGGFLSEDGALDFAGGTVVHINAGIAGLVAALILGRRKEPVLIPNNVPLVALGAGILWFGWFGFNAGSALTAGTLASIAFVNTNTATAAGALGWMVASWIKEGKPGSLGIASGAVAGLVAITPAAGFVDPLSSIVIGLVAGILCYNVMLFRIKKGIDESLDAWAVHGTGGLWGAIATGIFATTAVNSYSGLIYGNVHQFVLQIIAACSSIVYAFVVTVILVLVVDKTIGFRVADEEEYVGLDISQHGEIAYS